MKEPYKKVKYGKKKKEENQQEIPPPKKVKESKVPSSIKFDFKELFAVVGVALLFLIVGSIGMGKYFTTDETAWFYTWIQTYWNSYASGNFEGTNFSNYPGVFHSFLISITNLFLDQPAYMSPDKIETYLFWWRFPILLFNSLSLILIYYLLRKFFTKIQSLTIVFITAFTPVILGMSRIVNSDSLLWSVSFISILSYIVFVREEKFKYLLISGVFMGFALASKLNAVTLFIYQPVTLAVEFIYQKIDAKKLKQALWKTPVVILIALSVFSLLLPAVFVQPSLYNARIFEQFVTNPLFWTAVIFLIVDTFILKNKILTFFRDKIKLEKIVTIGFPALFAFIVLFSVFIKYMNIDSFLRETEYAEWETPFHLAILENFYSFYVSNQFFVIAGLLMFAVVGFVKKFRKEDASLPILMLVYVLLFIVGVALKGLGVAGHRYIIMLYPMLAIITVWSFSLLKKQQIAIFAIIALMSLIDVGILFPKYYAFYQNRNYFNGGQKRIVWAIGGYDLAQKMNEMDNAQNLKVLADRYSFKLFFEGETKNIIERVNGSDILEHDYLYLSKSGKSQVSMTPPLEYYYNLPKDSFLYYIGSEKRGWAGIVKVDTTIKYLEIENTYDPEYYLDLSKNWTISFWINPAEKNAGRMIYVGKSYVKGIGFRVSEQKMQLQYGKNEKITSTDTLALGRLNHVVIQHIANADSTQQTKIWIDGKLNVEKQIRNLKSESLKFFIATNYKGAMNDVRIYNIPLSAEQVAQIYNNGEINQEKDLFVDGEMFSPVQHFIHRQNEE